MVIINLRPIVVTFCALFIALKELIVIIFGIGLCLPILSIKWRMSIRDVWRLASDLDSIGKFEDFRLLDRKSAHAWKREFDKRRRLAAWIRAIFGDIEKRDRNPPPK